MLSAGAVEYLCMISCGLRRPMRREKNAPAHDLSTWRASSDEAVVDILQINLELVVDEVVGRSHGGRHVDHTASLVLTE